MSMIQEFKDFINKGNVVDLAVGVVIGAAFGKVVNSFVEDIVMPPIGLLMGGKDFKEVKTILKAADEAAKTPEIAIKWGVWLNTIIAFIIIAFVIFMIVKAYNRMKQADAEAPAPPSASEVLLGEIRDLLKK